MPKAKEGSRERKERKEGKTYGCKNSGNRLIFFAVSITSMVYMTLIRQNSSLRPIDSVRTTGGGMKKKIRTVWKTDYDSVGDTGDNLHHRRMSRETLPFFVKAS